MQSIVKCWICLSGKCSEENKKTPYRRQQNAIWIRKEGNKCRISQNKGQLCKEYDNRTKRTWRLKLNGIVFSHAVVFWFRDIAPHIIHLLALQLSVICLQDTKSLSPTTCLLNFPKYPDRLQLYHEIFISERFTCPCSTKAFNGLSARIFTGRCFFSSSSTD